MAAEADPDLRPLYSTPARPSRVAVDADGTILLSDDSSFNPAEEADFDIGRPPSPRPDEEPPGFHASVRARVDGYGRRAPGDWSGQNGGVQVQELRARARHVYFERAPGQWIASQVWEMNRLPGTGFKFLTPALQDDIRVIGSVFKDRSITNLEPFIVTAKRNNYLLKSDIRYFLTTQGVIEYRMMDALFAAVAAIPDVRGPKGEYDYGGPYQRETVALPAITWDRIYHKWRYMEGEGDRPCAPPGYLPADIDPALNVPGDPTNLHGSVRSSHAILLPILLDGDHWMFAYIHFRRRTVLIVNSEWEARDNSKNWRKVEKYIHYWNLQNLSAEPHTYPKRWMSIRVGGSSFARATREQGSGLASVIGALLVVCNVYPKKEIPTELVDVRAFLAAVLSNGGFRGNVYFPHQDDAKTRPWGDWFENKDLWARVGRREISEVEEPVG